MTINHERLHDITGGDEDFRKELLTMFIATARRCVARMASGTDNDFSAAAHELKGAADNLGFTAIAKHCRTVEHNVPAAQEKAALLGTLGTMIAEIENTIG